MMLEFVWRLDVPLKVKAFRWRCFINKLPTKYHLTHIGIIPSSNTTCVFCSVVGETALHSLVSCHVARLVWRDMAEWVGFLSHRGLSFKESFLEWFNFYEQIKIRKSKEGVLWLATCWTIQLDRKTVFRSDKWNISDMLWRAKALA